MPRRIVCEVVVADYTLRQLEYFVAVAEAGSITRAASAVHLSQSAMSTALTDLEGALGIQLLVRHHAKGITLTPAGRQLLVASRQLLASAADLRSAAHGLGGSLTGTLTIGCFEVMAPYLLPELLSVAAEKLPNLELVTTEVDMADLAEGVANGTFEMGIGYDLVDDPRLKRWPLRRVPPYALVAGSHRLAKRRKVRLADLADEPMALLDLPHSRDYFRQVFADAGVEPVVRYRSTTVETCRALVGRGLAYTVLNLQSAVPMALDGHPVAAIPIADETPALTMVLLNAIAARPTRRAAVVAELCRDLFGDTSAQ
ncbi:MULTISPECIES: LysR family transcriptional regulator [Gordonia]|uniref:LysR family transcriptional regulator n=1 Tax=Gordonia TaxID=2053 RepID=UPI0007EB947E|nr:MULTISPECIES: LysR family transcriptional regulator [Gordonia]MCM3896068.1 LysR family transcriptional regulator [Gordonia sputi]OBA38152.1 LysR family transcriptional regulator [Gordonia sp. 852002-51296_SCH5728562-b]OBB98924.1 LysR family transcriptional regulator [Gordonia sp. 852002-50395_SCH5434458]